MQQAIDEAGYIWPVDNQGNVIGPSLGNVNQPQGMQIKPADPARQYAGPKAAAEAQGSQLDNRYKEIQIKEATEGKLPVGWRRRADGGAEPIPGVPVKDPNKPALTAAERANAIAGYQSALALDKVIAQLEEQYRAGPGATSGLGGILDYLPFEENQRFDSTGNAARGTVGQALGFTGGQLNSVQEAEMSVGPYLPQSSDKDGVIRDKIGRLKQVRDDAMARSIAMLGGVPDANGMVTPLQQGQTILPRAAGAQADPGIGPTDVTSEGGLRYEQGLAGLPDAVANMVAQGAQPSEITAFLNQQYAPFGAHVGPDMAAAISTLVQRHRADPRAPVKSLSTGWDNFAMLPGQQESTALGRVADTDVGNFLMHAANAATAGLPGYLAGDQGAAVLDASRQSRPLSSLGGEITGGTAAMLGAGGITNAAARSSIKPIAMVGRGLRAGGYIGNDIAYGATRGALENGPAGAVAGAIAGGVGNKLGSGIANTTGRIVRGVSDPAVNVLAERGIPMSLGSLLGNRSIPGKLINRFESAPIIGDMFAARRADSIDAFNREAFNDAVAPLGGRVASPGREGMNEALGIVDEGYRNAIGDTSVDTADPGFRDAITASRSRMAEIPTIGQELAYNFDNNVAPLFENGINGERLQAALRSLREMQAGYAGQPMGQAARDAVGEAEGALRGLVAGQRPDVLPKLDAANAAPML
jgi:hypothetical protein